MLPPCLVEAMWILVAVLSHPQCHHRITATKQWQSRVQSRLRSEKLVEKKPLFSLRSLFTSSDHITHKLRQHHYHTKQQLHERTTPIGAFAHNCYSHCFPLKMCSRTKVSSRERRRREMSSFLVSVAQHTHTNGAQTTLKITDSLCSNFDSLSFPLVPASYFNSAVPVGNIPGLDVACMYNPHCVASKKKIVVRIGEMAVVNPVDR